MDIFTKIADDRIREAMAKGEFDNLEGSGKPLRFEDETWIPEDLRLVYRILKNSGCVPEEVEMRKEIINLKKLLNTIDDDKERLRKFRELNFRILKLNMLRKRPLNLEDFPEYEERIFEKHENSR